VNLEEIVVVGWTGGGQVLVEKWNFTFPAPHHTPSRHPRGLELGS
jgi:hypothetical protein